MILRDGSGPSSGPPGGSDCATGVGVPAPVLSDDELLEQGIDHAYTKLVAAATREDREHWCKCMYRLIRSRSQERVASLEQAKKLDERIPPHVGRCR